MILMALKIGSSSFKYTDKQVFVDGRKYKATQGVWELLTKSKPDKNVVTFQDRHINKYSYSLTRIELTIVPQVRSKQTKESSIRGLFPSSLLTRRKFLGNLCNVSR